MTAPPPKFSIIMNVYNGAAYLRQALDCVIEQTCGDWELIFFDDRSTDTSAAIFAEYDDPRFRYFLAPQQVPLGQARDQAIRHARGQWLAFLDQDDLWTANKLQLQSELIDADRDGSLGIVYGRTMQFDPQGKVWDFDRWHEFSKMPQGNIFNELIDVTCFIAMSSAVLRKSAVDALGGIPREIENSPDYFLYVNLAQKYRAACVQETCCWYRIHANNMSHTRRIAVHSEILRIVEPWAAAVEPRVYRRRQRIQQTLIGLEELTSRNKRVGGLRRILRDGSLVYLASRPFVRVARQLRRRLNRQTNDRARAASPLRFTMPVSAGHAS